MLKSFYFIQHGCDFCNSIGNSTHTKTLGED